MKILYWLEPHLDLIRPGVMKTWLGWFERIANNLCSSATDVDFRIVCLDSPAAIEREVSLGNQLIMLTQAELRAHWLLEGNAFIQLEHDRVHEDVCAQLELVLRKRLGSFEPTIVFLLTQQPWLRRVFPNALFVNIELSWTSRAPFPSTWQLDIAGAGKGRLLADYTDNLMQSFAIDKVAECFLDQVQSIAREHLIKPMAGHFVRSIRESFTTVTLFPISAFDHSDGRTPFFSALDNFLAEQRGDSAFVLTQHPMWQLLSREEITYLASKYPFLYAGGEIGSQYLLPWVDCVIGDFSTVASQALFFETQVISVRREIMHGPVDTLQLNPLVDILAGASELERKKILYWLLSRYAIPEERLFNGIWLDSFLRRAIIAVQEGKPWAAYEETTSTIHDWLNSKWRVVPTDVGLKAEARLYFSEVVEGIPLTYSEERSVESYFLIDNKRHILRFPMPVDLMPIAKIRFDPANRPMALFLHRMALVLEDGTELWSWSGDLKVFKNVDGLVFRHHIDSLLLLSLDVDPRFDLVLPDEVLARLQPNSCLIVDMTPRLLFDVCTDVLIQDDRLITELRAKLADVHLGERRSLEIDPSQSSLHLASDLENLSILIRNSLKLSNQTISQQSIKLKKMREDMVRAEAQLDLLKDLMLGGREIDLL